MTVKEYNKIYSYVGNCRVVLDNLDEILKEKDIDRLYSLIPDNFSQIMEEALDVYLINIKMQINPNKSVIDRLEPFLNWCKRTGSEFTSENYDEWLTQESIEEIFKDN